MAACLTRVSANLHARKPPRQVQGFRRRLPGLVTLGHQPPFPRIRNHGEPRAGIEDRGRQPGKRFIQIRRDRAHLTGTARTINPARMSLPPGRLPMIGRHLRSFTHPEIRFRSLDHGKLVRADARERENSGRRDRRLAQHAPGIAKCLSFLRYVAQQMCRALDAAFSKPGAGSTPSPYNRDLWPCAWAPG